MRFAAQYPMPAEPSLPPGELAADVAAFARAAEAAGFDAIAFTEHPAPSHKWLLGGGHASFDPYVVLAFCAGVTQRLRLISYLAVLPYRNPLLTAKSAVSLDVLSGGRLILTCGTGYLRSEFRALGVDFEERNDLFDEALDVLRSVWAAPEEFSFSGRHFVAGGQTLRPAPVQPRAPIWIGGNSARARDRVVRVGTGWAPLFADETVAATSRTPAMRTIGDFTAAVGDLRHRAEAAGRDPGGIDVCVPSSAEGGNRRLEWLGQLEAAGATWTVCTVEGASAAENLEVLAGYGDEVITGLAKG